MINGKNKFVDCLCRDYIRSFKTLIKLSEKVTATLYIAVRMWPHCVKKAVL